MLKVNYLFLYDTKETARNGDQEAFSDSVGRTTGTCNVIQVSLLATPKVLCVMLLLIAGNYQICHRLFSNQLSCGPIYQDLKLL